MGKGDDAERNWTDVMKDRGYRSMRAPASGGATKRDRPDAIAGNYRVNRVVASEVKNQEGHVYIGKEEVAQLLMFCANFGAEPWFSFDWNYNSEYDYSFVNLTPAEVVSMKETQKSFRVEQERAKEIGHHRNEFIKPRFEQDKHFEFEVDRGFDNSFEVSQTIPYRSLLALCEDVEGNCFSCESEFIVDLSSDVCPECGDPNWIRDDDRAFRDKVYDDGRVKSIVEGEMLEMKNELFSSDTLDQSSASTGIEDPVS